MTLIIGIFTRDIHVKKEIIFASDGLAVKYENDKKIGQDEDEVKVLVPSMDFNQYRVEFTDHFPVLINVKLHEDDD